MDTRIIHTKLYSNIALEVLQSVEGNLSDGMWENSPAMEKYWRFSDVETAPDGEVVIKISTESGKYNKYSRKRQRNGFDGMPDADIINWFADKIKHIIKTELKDYDDKIGWKRDNTDTQTGYLAYNEKITVADIYYIYEFLKGRDVTKKYDGDMGLKIVRAPKSDEETKKEEARRENIDAINSEWSNVRKQLDDEKQQQIKLIETEYLQKMQVINTEFKAKLDALRI